MYRVKTLRLFFNSTSVCTCIIYYLAAAAAKAIPSINCLKSGRKKKIALRTELEPNKDSKRFDRTNLMMTRLGILKDMETTATYRNSYAKLTITFISLLTSAHRI